MDTKDLGAGAFFGAAGLLYGGVSYTTLSLGSSVEPGPGYFPLALGALLFLIGVVLILRALWAEGLPEPRTIPWKAIAFMSAATIFFAILLRPLGLPLTVVGTTLIASLAAPHFRPVRALISGCVLALFSTLLFAELLQLQVPVFGTWIGG